MNIKNPLAAAFLMTASAVLAQPYAANPGWTGPGGTTSNLFSLNGASAPDDDMLFKCSTVPYIACTPAQLNRREAMQRSGKCPEPASKACVDYLMSNAGSVNPAETIAAKDPGKGNEWLSPDCTQIPCRTKPAKEDASEAAAHGPAPQPGDPGFIGPLLPPGFYDKQDKEALAKARAEIGQDGVKDVVDLGGGRLAMMLDDGRVGICTRSQCEKPVPADSVKDPKVAAWVASNKMTDGSSGGGGMKSLNAPGDRNNPARTGGGPTDESGGGNTTPPGSSNPARNLGAEIAGDQNSLAKGFGAAVASTGGGAAGLTGTGAEAVVKVDGATIAKPSAIPLTYSRLQQNSDQLEETAGGVRAPNGVFAAPGDTPDANEGNHEFRGTQSGANK